MKVPDQLKWLAQSTAIFTVYSYLTTHFPVANATEISTEWYSTVVNYNLMHDVNDQTWSNYENISMLMVGNSTEYDTSFQNYLGAISEGNIDEALVWGLKTAVFIADDEALLSDIVNDNEYYLQYVSNDTLSNVTGYLEAKLGTSASAYYNVDKKVT